MKAALFAGLALAACTGSDPVTAVVDGGPDLRPDAMTTAPDPDAMTTAPDPDAAPATAELAACDGLALTRDFTLMPAPTDAHYLRCETRGVEAGRGVIVSHDASRVAVLTSAGTVRLFATAPWEELAQLTAPIGRIETAAFSPDGARLATFSAEMGEVTLWRAGDAARDRSFALPPPSMMEVTDARLAFSSDGRRLAVSSNGAVIDVDAGTVTPEAFGGTARDLAWVPGDDVVFVDAHYQIGNSPTSEALVLNDLVAGTQTTLFQAYDRALHGYALSADASRIAFATDAEASPAGLRIHRTTDGAQLAYDAAFAGTVVGFSHDASRLITIDAHTVSVLDVTDLHVVDHFDLPAGSFEVVGVSPEDDLVVAFDGSTRWYATDTGEVRQTLARSIDRATWSADGAYGAGTGDGAFFVLWRESDATELCHPPVMTGDSAAIDALGTPVGDEETVTSEDGSTTVASSFYLHGHATNYYEVHVTDAATTAELRAFAPSSSRSLVMTQPDAARIYTQEASAITSAGWCR